MPSTFFSAAGRYRFWLVLSVLLGVQAALACDCARRWSPTHDEYWHLPLGLRSLTLGRFDADPINPPLPRLLAAMPLFIAGVELGTDSSDAASTDGHGAPDAYEVGDAFLQAHRNDFLSLYFRGRVMMIGLGLLGGLATAAIARHWYGDASGMLAGLLWCCCPTLLAHHAIVAHDLPVTVAAVGTFAALIWLTRQFTWTRAALFGVVLGLAQLTKFSALVLYPLLTVCGLLMLPRDQLRAWKPVVQKLGLIGVLSLLVVNLGYLDLSPIERWQRVADQVADAREDANFSWSNVTSLGATALLPRDFVAGGAALRDVLRQPHPVYLDGEWAEAGGFRDYYLRGPAYKLTPTLLICLPLGVFSILVRRRESRELVQACTLLLAVLTFIVPASLSGNQLGIRYILPAFPFLILLAAPAARWLDFRATPRRAAIVLLAVVSAPLALRHHPHHLSYFNVLAGGPANGWRHLVDSNVDWGQDLHALRQHLETHNVDEIRLAYFGTVSPSVVGIAYTFPPPREPQPGRYAISVNFLAGRPHHLRDLDGRSYHANLDDFGYFRFFVPDAQIGHSIWFYDLSAEDVARLSAARAALQ